MDNDERWKLKQELASPSLYYGDGGTLHSNRELDIETYNGKVVAVWFRCTKLPFRVIEVDENRAKEMNHDSGVELTGVEILRKR